MTSRQTISALVLFATVTTAAPAGQQAPLPERERLEGMARQATDRIRTLQREADDLAARERTVLSELRGLEVQRQLEAEELNQISLEVRTVTRELDEARRLVEALNESAERQRPDVASRLAALYRLGPPRYGPLLLEVEDVRLVGRVYRIVSAMTEMDRRDIETYRTTLDALEKSQVSLADRRDEQTALELKAQRARAALEEAIATQARLVRAIDTERDLNAQLIGELRSTQQRLQRTLAQLASSGSASDAPVALPLASFRGALDWPVAGPVTTLFGLHRQTRFGTTIVRSGIDIAAAEGVVVKATHAGVVAFSDVFTGFGNLVILDHGGQSYTLYGYLGSLAVPVGARVSPGTAIGSVGRSATGESALYFELRIDGKPVDPLEWLKRR